MILPVPWQSQWDATTRTGDGNCGPASLTMALEYYGSPVGYEGVRSTIRNVSPGTGNTNFEWPVYLNILHNNHLDYAYSGNPADPVLKMSNFAAIKSQLDQHHPVIMAVNNAYGKALYASVGGIYGVSHIIVVTGYQTDQYGTIQTVYINDPLAIKPPWPYSGDAEHGKNFQLQARGAMSFSSAAGVEGSWYGAAVVIARPSNLTTAPTSNSVRVNWQESFSNVDHFVLYDGPQTVPVSGSARSFTWTGLAANARLCTIVQAVTKAGNTRLVNGAQSNWSDWACTSTLTGAPSIQSVSATFFPTCVAVTGIYCGPSLTISGSGFGSRGAYDGDSAYIEIEDSTRNWRAGWSNDPGGPNSVHLNITSWQDNRIVVAALTGAFQTNGWFFNRGDRVVVRVWNAQSGAGPATYVLYANQ